MLQKGFQSKFRFSKGSLLLSENPVRFPRKQVLSRRFRFKVSSFSKTSFFFFLVSIYELVCVVWCYGLRSRSCLLVVCLCLCIWTCGVVFFVSFFSLSAVVFEGVFIRAEAILGCLSGR